MEQKKYSAGSVKLSFWFMEFRKVVALLVEGKSFDEIKLLNQERNIFGAPTNKRAEQILKTVSARVEKLNPSFYPIFQNSDISTQKLIALIATMANDDLFFDFVYEVIREKMIIGSNEFADSDIRIFFKEKQVQDEKVAGWTDETIARLGRCYKTMLYEAGITDKGRSVRRLYKPIIPIDLEQWLKDNRMDLMIHVLTGVR